jgi:choline monooxygenase
MENTNQNTLKKLHSFNPTPPIEEASMPPASWYTDADIQKLERANIFQKSWWPIIKIDDFCQKNMYLTGHTNETPWLLIRNHQGELKAFFNVCRHKGREVTTGKGDCSSCELTCGYHGWKFHIDGQLKSAPKMGGIKNFNREEMGLVPMNVQEWGHWIFINPSKEKKNIECELEILDKQLSLRNWTKLQFHSQKSWTINCNWKVYIDNYLDGGYHIPLMHPSLDAQLDMESYKTVCFKSYSIQTSGPTKKNSQDLSYNPQERIGDGSIYAWIFPNFMVNLYGNCMDTNYVIPISEHQCQVFYEFYFTQEEEEEFIQNSIKQADITQVEDIEICESVQLGLNSGAYQPGRYAPLIEQGEYHFHQLLSEYYLK